MSVQRNALVSPYPQRTPLLVEKQNTPSFAHIKWNQQVEQAVNLSPQISSNVPAHASSPGQPGTMVFGPGGVLYVCFAANQWWKFTGVAF